MSDIRRYLEMERSVYAKLVARSNFRDGLFATSNTRELVVGSYAQHESFDYERWLLSGVDVGPDAVALEYGCGPGRMLRRIAAICARVDGIDISPEVLEVARELCADLSNPPRLYLTDGQDVPVEADSYDIAYSVICLQHICVYTVRKTIFAGLYRALKPGGLLTFQMGYAPGHAARVDYFTDYVEAGNTNGAVDVTVLHPAELAIDLREIGFGSMWFALTPTGPGDTHGAWIFFRALKPGSAASLTSSEQDFASSGFAPAVPDARATTLARKHQNERGLMKRSRQEAKTIRQLRREIDALKRSGSADAA